MEKRRVRGDKITTYKSFNCDYIIMGILFYLKSLKKICGHTMKLDKRQFNVKLHEKFFTFRAVKMCNSF